MHKLHVGDATNCTPGSPKSCPGAPHPETNTDSAPAEGTVPMKLLPAPPKPQRALFRDSPLALHPRPLLKPSPRTLGPPSLLSCSLPPCRDHPPPRTTAPTRFGAGAGAGAQAGLQRGIIHPARRTRRRSARGAPPRWCAASAAAGQKEKLRPSGTAGTRVRPRRGSRPGLRTAPRARPASQGGREARVRPPARAPSAPTRTAACGCGRGSPPPRAPSRVRCGVRGSEAARRSALALETERGARGGLLGACPDCGAAPRNPRPRSPPSPRRPHCSGRGGAGGRERRGSAPLGRADPRSRFLSGNRPSFPSWRLEDK
ncbi:translation initiation factor IF-2-like [Sorex fumeus]|uniref:translation initiation factor IF-2-like n=1 Tax=Sorex fumeus TaxID=62283 RepID=UPI0024ADBF6D|nr:translation initiation factor IF-2-like [Sorex fumeus]